MNLLKTDMYLTTLQITLCEVKSYLEKEKKYGIEEQKL